VFDENIEAFSHCFVQLNLLDIVLRVILVIKTQLPRNCRATNKFCNDYSSFRVLPAVALMQRCWNMASQAREVKCVYCGFTSENPCSHRKGDFVWREGILKENVHPQMVQGV